MACSWVLAAKTAVAARAVGMGGVGGVLAASLQTAGRCRLSVVARGTGSPWAAKLPLSPLPPPPCLFCMENENQ